MHQFLCSYPEKSCGISDASRTENIKNRNRIYSSLICIGMLTHCVPLKTVDFWISLVFTLYIYKDRYINASHDFILSLFHRRNIWGKNIPSNFFLGCLYDSMPTLAKLFNFYLFLQLFNIFAMTFGQGQ